MTAKDDSVVLTKNTDYTVSYSEDIVNVGMKTVKVTGKGNYSGTQSKTFSIGSKSVAQLTIILSSTSYVYSGKAKTPTVTIKYGTIELAKDKDFTVVYDKDNVNAGTKTVNIKGQGNYSGTTSTEFVIKPKSINGMTVTLSKPYYTYDGFEKEPDVRIKDGKTILEEYEDYEVSYTNNKNAGEATAIAKGKGNYTGTASQPFTIKPKSFVEETIKVTLSEELYNYNGTAQKPTVTVKDGTKDLTQGTDYTVVYCDKDNISIGTKTVRVTGKGNYADTKTKFFEILPVRTNFEPKKDTWNFINKSGGEENLRPGFNNKACSEQIRKEYKVQLAKNLTDSEYQTVFNGYDGKKENSWMEKDWSGSCYGMATIALLSKNNNLLPFGNYQSGASKLIDLESPSINFEVQFFNHLLSDVTSQEEHSTKLSQNIFKIK